MGNERDLPWMYWLAGCFSVRRKTKEKLLDMYGTAENIYNMKKQVLNEPGFLTDREKEAFLQRGKLHMDRRGGLSAEAAAPLRCTFCPVLLWKAP